ncbi:hypothetical protein FHW68_002386 [Pseudomonas sp. Tn43]|nr:hypothetical protein [Pseudomonas sp. Tn43]
MLPLIHLHQSDVFDSVYDYPLSLEEYGPRRSLINIFRTVLELACAKLRGY